MKAIVMDKFGDASVLHIGEVETPKPAEREVLIKIAYTGVNPVDWKIREGHIQNLLPHEFPIIPGWDAAGTIESVGKNVKGFQKGDRVFAYCRKPKVKMGTYAEYICFDADHVAKIPSNLSFAQAAAIPLVALTAWQALFDEAKLKKGQTVLIHAGAGGVGSMAIQFAKIRGAHVITTASAKNHGYVKKLGADEVIDYTREDFVKAVRKKHPEGVDIVLDCVGDDTLKRSFEITKPNGALVSIVNRPSIEKAKEKNLHTNFVFVRPDGKQLKEIADLIATGKALAPNIFEMPLTDAAKAHNEISKGHTAGKIVLKI